MLRSGKNEQHVIAVPFWLRNMFQFSFQFRLFLGLFLPQKVKSGTLIGSLCCSFVKIIYLEISQRYQAELISNILLFRCCSIKKIKLLSLRNQKIRVFMHRFCCILYETHRIIKNYWVLFSLSFLPWLSSNTKLLVKMNRTTPNSMELCRLVTEFLWTSSNSIIRPW